MRQYLVAWLESVTPSLAPNTRLSYAGRIKRLDPVIGKYKLSTLSAMEIQRALATLLQSYAPSNVRSCRGLLHRALADAVKWNILPRNPVDLASSPRVPKRPMQVFSEDEVRKLFDATTGDHYHTLWVLMATTGLRLGEATGLRWEDVDSRDKKLTVQSNLQRIRGQEMQSCETKNAYSRRVVHLAPSTLALLKKHKAHQAEAKLSQGAEWENTADLVFTTTRGTPIDPSNINKAWDRTLQRLKLPPIRIHDMRHTAATVLLKRGVHPKKVQGMLGHASIRTTLDLYSHVMPAMHEEVAQHMEALFSAAEGVR